MKKLISIILMLTLIISLAACGKADNGSDESTKTDENVASKAEDNSDENTSDVSGDDSLQKVLDAGVLHVITEGNWKPFIYYENDNPDQLTGYCIEIARAVGEELGVEVEFDLTDSYDAVLAGLKTGRYDCVSEGLPSVAIAEDMCGTDPYMETWTVLVAKKGSEEIKSWEDIAGKTSVNALSGSLGEIARKYGAEIVDGNIEGAMTMIQNGQADCTVNSQIAVNSYLMANPDADIEIVDKYYDGTLEETLETIQGGFTLMKGQEALLGALNDALAKLEENGTMKELSIQFFGEAVVNDLELFK